MKELTSLKEAYNSYMNTLILENIFKKGITENPENKTNKQYDSACISYYVM